MTPDRLPAPVTQQLSEFPRRTRGSTSGLFAEVSAIIQTPSQTEGNPACRCSKAESFTTRAAQTEVVFVFIRSAFRSIIRPIETLVSKRILKSLNRFSADGC